MINLNVLYTEIKSGRSAATLMSIGAALIECIQGVVAAIVYSRLIYLSNYTYIFKIATGAVFAVLAIYYIMKKKNSENIFSSEYEKNREKPFLSGLLLSSLNFMAIPFWLVILTLISQYLDIKWTSIRILSFGIGAGLGGFLASMTYALIGRRWLAHSGVIRKYLDYIIAFIFVVMSILAFTYE